MVALFYVHIAACIIAALFSRDYEALPILGSLIVCQTNLLGMWGALGETPWLLRLIGVFVGSVYLSAWFCFGIRELEGVLVTFVFAATFLMVAVTSIMRVLTTMIRASTSLKTRDRKRLQFTIRHLMALTFVVACALTAGKVFAPFVPGLEGIAMLLVLAMCVVAVGVTTIWAWLGLGNPAIRSVFVVLVAAGASWVGPIILGGDSYLFWIPVVILQAIFLTASLAVVRKCGYRLVARRLDEP